jgi:ABC-type uncharacterized transport system ATPase subunit
MVHQHFMLVDTLTALENVMLGAEPHVLLHKAEAQVRGKLVALMTSTGLRVDLDALVADLSVGDRQRLEILKTLYRGARILILDEPTAVLTPQETEQLFGVLALLRGQGTTILLITHKLKEVMRLCDFVTVMRGGRVVQDVAIADTSIESLAEAMVGRKVQMGRQGDTDKAPGAVLMQASGIVVRDALQVVRLQDVALRCVPARSSVLPGSPATARANCSRCCPACWRPVPAALEVGGASFRPGAWIDPRKARSLGVAHVPEDRHERAMVMSFEAWESAVLGYEWLAVYCRQGWMDHPHMQGATVDMMERFDVRPRNAHLISAAFRAATSRSWCWRASSGRRPACCWWGSPPAASTSGPSSSSIRSCAPCATPAARCWWCPASWTRSWRWPTA